MGYTHEDIDGTFGRLSTILKEKDMFSLKEMMDTYRTCKDHNSYVSY
jgi:hypothetical protein